MINPLGRGTGSCQSVDDHESLSVPFNCFLGTCSLFSFLPVTTWHSLLIDALILGVELRSCYESRNCIADDRVALSFSVLGFSILDPGTAD